MVETDDLRTIPTNETKRTSVCTQYPGLIEIDDFVNKPLEEFPSGTTRNNLRSSCEQLLAISSVLLGSETWLCSTINM